MDKEHDAKPCASCLYCYVISIGNTCCDYLLLTGHSRKCSPEECREKGVCVKVAPRKKQRARAEMMKKFFNQTPASRKPFRQESLSVMLQRPERASQMYLRRAPEKPEPEPELPVPVHPKSSPHLSDPRRRPPWYGNLRCCRCHRAMRVPGRMLCPKCVKG